jgi:hypothetical protein
MTAFNRNMIALALALVLALALSRVAHAELPSARSLFDAHVAAISGHDAAMNTTGSIKSTVEIVETGMKGNVDLYRRGDDWVMRITVPVAGETRIGYVGGVAWSIDSIFGPRILEGKQRQHLAEQFDPMVTMRDASLIASATTTALSDSDGRPCYHVEITWNTGSNTADCYSTDDGLLLSTESTTSLPIGEFKQVSHFYDYTTFGKSKAAKLTKEKVADGTQVMQIESIDETDPGDAPFVLPAEIKALLGKAAAAD